MGELTEKICLVVFCGFPWEFTKIIRIFANWFFSGIRVCACKSWTASWTPWACRVDIIFAPRKLVTGYHYGYGRDRVAEVGSFSARAKMATKNCVTRVFAIFLKNASFLRVIANLPILFSTMQYIPCNSAILDQETLRERMGLPKTLSWDSWQ